MSPEEKYLGEDIQLAINQGSEFPDDDCSVTIRLKKTGLRDITRTINLSALFELIRDNVDEDGCLLNERDLAEDDEDEDSLD
jgi:hypothetical protein